VRLAVNFPKVAVVLAILSILGSRYCRAQLNSGVPDTAADPLRIQAQEAPFDKLELFAFFAAGPTSNYAAQIIQARGTSFTPDADFILAFPTPSFQAILKSTRARVPATLSADRTRAYELLRRAWEANQQHQFVAASDSYQQALQVAPDSATLHLAFATSLMLSHHFSEAEAQARQSIRLWPEYAEGHGELSLCLMLEERFPEAASEARETLRIFPQHKSAKFQLGVSLAQSRQYKEAIPALRDAVAAMPNDPVLRKFLGISLFETQQVDEGIAQLRLYLEGAPNDAEGHYYLGVALRLKGNLEEAHAQFQEALRLQPGNPQFEAAANPDTNGASTDAGPGPKPEDGSTSLNVYTNNFFDFTYSFPKGWTVLSSDAARGVLEFGRESISTGDATDTDTRRVVARQSHALLYVVEGQTGGQPISMKSVLVSAFDVRIFPEITPESYFKTIAPGLKQLGVPAEPAGAPEQVNIGGRAFWKEELVVHTATSSVHESQWVTSDKGFILMFQVSSSDVAGLAEIEESLQSIRFLHGSH